MKILVDYENLNINLSNNNGHTPLHIAVDRLNHDIVDLLLNYKQTTYNEYIRTLPKYCDVNQQDKDGNTALHLIVRNLSIFKLNEIKENGANKDVNILGIFKINFFCYKKSHLFCCFFCNSLIWTIRFSIWIIWGTKRISRQITKNHI